MERIMFWIWRYQIFMKPERGNKKKIPVFYPQYWLWKIIFSNECVILLSFVAHLGSRHKQLYRALLFFHEVVEENFEKTLCGLTSLSYNTFLQLWEGQLCIIFCQLSQLCVWLMLPKVIARWGKKSFPIYQDQEAAPQPFTSFSVSSSPVSL